MTPSPKLLNRNQAESLAFLGSSQSTTEAGTTGRLVACPLGPIPLFCVLFAGGLQDAILRRRRGNSRTLVQCVLLPRPQLHDRFHSRPTHPRVCPPPGPSGTQSRRYTVGGHRRNKRSLRGQVQIVQALVDGVVHSVDHRSQRSDS